MFRGNQALAFLQLCYCNLLAASSFRHSHTFETGDPVLEIGDPVLEIGDRVFEIGDIILEIGDPVFEIEIVFVSNNHEMTTGHLLLCTVIVALLQ